MDAQRVAAIMTPRVNIYAVDMEASADEIRREVVESPYSRIVVCKGGLDNVLEVVDMDGNRIDKLLVLPPKTEGVT